MKGILAAFTHFPGASVRPALFLGAALLLPAVGTSQIVVKVDSSHVRKPGFAIDHDVMISRCATCHVVDSLGRMSRISYMRKTPEGWQASIRRMVSLNDVEVTPEEAREIVRYLSNRQGLAPEELRPGLFEVERRLIEYAYTADSLTENTCHTCHSLGRVITQRRTKEEWSLLADTHTGLYGTFRSFGPGSTRGKDRALAHLSQVFPLETPEWREWSATMRWPKLAGGWALTGYEAGRGPVAGRMEIAPKPGTEDEFTTSATYTYLRGGRTVTRRGRVIIYTGYQWRGRSFEGTDESGETALREVMFVERNSKEIFGRWFRGGYDEFGLDVRLRRIEATPVVTMVTPRALKRGGEHEVHLHGASLPDGLAPPDLDLGPGVEVLDVKSARPEGVVVRVSVAAAAALGPRDLFLGGLHRPAAIVVYDRIDRIRVIPEAGMARIGGHQHPKMFAQFEALAYDDGEDDEPGTADDLVLDVVEVKWSMEEYPATFGDDDIDFVGELDEGGFFTPAMEGPNPKRSGERNNVGDVWVIATFDPKDGRAPLRARAHLLVTVPLYMRWEPWRVQEESR